MYIDPTQSIEKYSGCIIIHLYCEICTQMRALIQNRMHLLKPGTIRRDLLLRSGSSSEANLNLAPAPAKILENDFGFRSSS